MTSLAELKFRIKLNLTKIEFYENYKKNIETSINNVNDHLTELNKSIDYLRYYVETNKFPLDYPKWCISIKTNRAEINDTSSKFLINTATVLKQRIEKLRTKNEIESNYNEAIEWCKIWEDIKKTFISELNQVEKFLENLNVEIIHCKKALLDLDLPPTQNNQIDKNEPPTNVIEVDNIKIDESTLNDNKGIKITEITETDSQALITPESGNKSTKLRPPKRGELKELCIKFAKEYKFVMGITLTKESIKKVSELIANEGILTTEGSVGSKLRDLGYKKEKH